MATRRGGGDFTSLGFTYNWCIGACVFVHETNAFLFICVFAYILVAQRANRGTQKTSKGIYKFQGKVQQEGDIHLLIWYCGIPWTADWLASSLKRRLVCWDSLAA